MSDFCYILHCISVVDCILGNVTDVCPFGGLVIVKCRSISTKCSTGSWQWMCYYKCTVLHIKTVLHRSKHKTEEIDTRHKHYAVDFLKVLFRDVPPEKIFCFLRESNIFSKIWAFIDHENFIILTFSRVETFPWKTCDILSLNIF